jgi:multiple sugar transport system substrate-binding protein
MIRGSSRMTRRSLLKTSGLAASALVLGACAKGTNSTGGSAATSDTITSASWDDGVGDLLKGPIADAWSKKSGKKLESQASVSFDDYQTRFRTLLAGGQPPDVMRLNDDFLGEISGKKLSKDLAPYFQKSGLNKDDFFPIFTWSDLPSGQRGLVVAQQVRVIYYNKTMFEKEGVPLPPTDWVADHWTWDNFLAAAKALTKGTEQYGAEVFADTGYEEIWSRNNGGPGTYSPDGKQFTLADPKGVEAVQWVADLTLKHNVQPSWGDLKPDQAPERMFIAGKLGMMLSTSSNVSSFNDSVKDFEWDLAPIPAKEHQYQQGSVVLYIIPEKGQNPDVAWDYLNFAIGEEGGKFIAEAGVSVPVNKKAAESLRSPGKYPKNINLLVTGADQNKIVNFTTGGSAAVTLFRPQLERVYTGDLTAAKALGDIRPQVEQALAAG